MQPLLQQSCNGFPGSTTGLARRSTKTSRTAPPTRTAGNQRPAGSTAGGAAGAPPALGASCSASLAAASTSFEWRGRQGGLVQSVTCGSLPARGAPATRSRPASRTAQARAPRAQTTCVTAQSKVAAARSNCLDVARMRRWLSEGAEPPRKSSVTCSCGGRSKGGVGKGSSPALPSSIRPCASFSTRASSRWCGSTESAT
mmetsp:Transcript_38168/g.121264  ORF Transcript_38168/g.121264 Transcript_38168/m.121264 type:complete len:200 (+) Transcript_38168:270-869(+)